MFSNFKVCEQKGVGDEYTAEQFYNLSQLMVDEVKQVREIFATKLHKGLNKGLPNKCLPLDFMGYYALAGNIECSLIYTVLFINSFTADILCNDSTGGPHLVPSLILKIIYHIINRLDGYLP